jgi:hypothetical protein
MRYFVFFYRKVAIITIPCHMSKYDTVVEQCLEICYNNFLFVNKEVGFLQKKNFTTFGYFSRITWHSDSVKICPIERIQA